MPNFIMQQIRAEIANGTQASLARAEQNANMSYDQDILTDDEYYDVMIDLRTAKEG